MLTSKLNGGNAINAINLQAGVIRYGSGLIKWTKGKENWWTWRELKEDCVDMEMNTLYNYVENSTKRLLMGVKDEMILGEWAAKKETYGKWKGQYNEVLHGQLKKETEGMLMAAQDQVLRTNHIKRIDKQDLSPMCRLYGEQEETISHIVAECLKLPPKQNRLWHHGRVALVIPWLLCKRSGMNMSLNIYYRKMALRYCGISPFKQTMR